MERSVYSREYAVFLQELKRARKATGVSQVELARRLETTQKWISKCEVGERRLDLIDVRQFCEALGLSFPAFAEQVEIAIQRDRASGNPKTTS
jgi:predicted transcriptional regulator